MRPGHIEGPQRPRPPASRGALGSHRRDNKAYGRDSSGLAEARPTAARALLSRRQRSGRTVAAAQVAPYNKVVHRSVKISSHASALLSGCGFGWEIHGPLQAVTASRAMRLQMTQQNSEGCGCEPPLCGSYSHNVDEGAGAFICQNTTMAPVL